MNGCVRIKCEFVLPTSMSFRSALRRGIPMMVQLFSYIIGIPRYARNDIMAESAAWKLPLLEIDRKSAALRRSRRSRAKPRGSGQAWKPPQLKIGRKSAALRRSRRSRAKQRGSGQAWELPLLECEQYLDLSSIKRIDQMLLNYHFVILSE